jgi:aminopeptidase N
MKTILIKIVGVITVLFLVACNSVSNTSEVKSTARKVSDQLTQDQATLRKGRVSNIAYTLDIDLISDPEAYMGTVNISFDLETNNNDLTIDFTGGSVNVVKVNETNVMVDYSGYFITLPAESLLKGKNNVVVAYSHPYGQDGTGLHRFTDPEDGNTYLYTYLWPYYANRLFPNFDQPNLKATYEMTVRAKGDWQVVSSVLEDNITADGEDKIWHFPRSKEFSSYVFSLHAGPYKVWSDMAGNIPIRLMARQSLADYVAVDEWFEFTKMGLTHYSNYFDIDYPFVKYDQVIVPDFNIGAMENVGAVTFAESFVQRGPSNRFERQRRAGTILHEMAHMWFGDLVTKDWWNGLWLNESFATLMSSIAVSNLPEFNDLWHDFYLSTNLSAINADKMVSSHPIEVKVPSTSDFFSVFDAITYQKGASVLNQLSHYVGQENFRLGVSTYLKEHAWGNTKLKDFIDAQSKQSGINLSPWAKSWLYKVGVNSIKADFTCDAGKITHFNIKQSVPKGYQTLRSQRIQLALFDVNQGGMKPYKVTQHTISGLISSISELEGTSCPTFVFPNYQGWGYTEVELVDVSKLSVLRAIEKSDDPFLRSMLWTSVLKNPDTNFEHVIELIKQEKNDRIIKQVIENLVKKVNRLERQGNDAFILLGSKLEELLWHQIIEGESSKSTRIVRLKNYINVVRTDLGRAHIVDLLEGTSKVPSLPISQEHRWLLIKRLAILNDKQAHNYISNEKLADQSDAGKRSAIAAESSLPDIVIKRQWIAAFMNNENPLPLSNQRAAMENIFPANQLVLQEELLAEMIRPLSMIRDTRDHYYQRSYARDLFAGICTIKGAAQIEAALIKDNIGTTLYRFLSENVQKAQSCVEELNHKKD